MLQLPLCRIDDLYRERHWNVSFGGGTIFQCGDLWFVLVLPSRPAPRRKRAPARSPSWGRFTIRRGLAAVQLLRHEADPTEAQDHHRRFAGMCGQRPTSSE
jgi:hypothetical protein